MDSSTIKTEELSYKADINARNGTQDMSSETPCLPTNINENIPEQNTIKDNERDLLDKFETMYQRLGGPQTIENPFEKIDPSEDMNSLWTKLGNNKMLGILHAFVLLRPLIKKAIEREEQVKVENEEGKIENESRLLNDMAMKVDYLNTVVTNVVNRVNNSK